RAAVAIMRPFSYSDVDICMLHTYLRRGGLGERWHRGRIASVLGGEPNPYVWRGLVRLRSCGRPSFQRVEPRLLACRSDFGGECGCTTEVCSGLVVLAGGGQRGGQVDVQRGLGAPVRGIMAVQCSRED